MKHKLRKYGLIIFLFLFSFSVFGQQFLWSTMKGDNIEMRFVPISEVTDEVLKFYEMYDRYYDYTGFSKKRFIEEFDFGFEDWKWIEEINELSVVAMKSNTGEGSVILVLCVSSENINMLLFTNHYMGSNYQRTLSYSSEEKEKFKRWFKTVLN